MQHLLDNPAWNALILGNKSLGEGTSQAKYFFGEVSPFAGMPQNTTENFDALHQLLPEKTTVAVFSPDEIQLTEKWKLVNPMRVLQMVHDELTPHPIEDVTLTALTKAHVSAMLALTKLTNPGPFFTRTIDFGNYFGILEGDELVAMTGRRLQTLPYMEVSAVCNHPDHSGKGYASRLIQHQVRLIKTDGGIPFLHVLTTNASAIKIYQKLGFKTRKEMNIWAIQTV